MPICAVLTANSVFFRTFHVQRAETEGRLVFDLGVGRWDMPRLRDLLAAVVAGNESAEDLELECDFPPLGRRLVVFNARHVRPTTAATR